MHEFKTSLRFPASPSRAAETQKTLPETHVPLKRHRRESEGAKFGIWRSYRHRQRDTSGWICWRIDVTGWLVRLLSCLLYRRWIYACSISFP